MSSLTKIIRSGFAVVSASALVTAAFAAPANAAPPVSASSYFANFESGNPNVSTSQFSQTSSGIEASSFADHPGNIYKFQTNAGCLGGFKMTTSGVLFTSTQKPVVALDVYAPVAASINIKVEKSTNQNIKAAKLVKINAGWNLDVSVDFSTVTGWDPTNEYDVLTLFPGYSCNANNGGAPSETYYVDNIQANGGDKPTPTIDSNPTASDITYGQSLANSTLSGGSASVDGSFVFTPAATVPNAGTNNQDVTFIPTDSHNYRNATTTVSVKVNQVVPTVITSPSASNLTYGGFVGQSVLAGQFSVNGTLTWSDLVYGYYPNAGTEKFAAVFTPNDPNYATLTVDVSLTTDKRSTYLYGLVSAPSITYGQSLSDTTISTGSCDESFFGSNPVPCVIEFTSPTTKPNAGENQQFDVTYTPTDSNNYTGGTGQAIVTVNKATPTISVNPTASDIQYGSTFGSSNLSGGVASVPGTFAFSNPSGKPDIGSGLYEVWFYPTDSDNYESVKLSVNLNVYGPWITSVDRVGYWSYVSFTLPTLDAGKRYDRVAYRINGGKWVLWGKFSKSAQKLTGIKSKRNYTVQIRAHVAKGDWTGVSNIVPFYAGAVPQ